MEQENKNQMNGNSGQAPQQDGLYHYSYMNNSGDSRFDRPSTNASQQTQNVQGAQSAQNNQTAGVHGSAQNSQTAGAQGSAQNASYSGFQRNVNGMEAWYDSQRMNQGYQNQAGNPMNNMGTGKPSDNNMRQKKAKDKKPKNRKSGFGKKAASVVAAAVVFGLVAGVVFQGSDMDRISFSAKIRRPQQSRVLRVQQRTMHHSSSRHHQTRQVQCTMCQRLPRRLCLPSYRSQEHT